ncbi:MAG: cellulase family glycosylhydrolase [Armatimonadota bacterium]|nr:cellulase family glycosylhydrolase [Armatimonadota bacterium]
MAQPAARRLPTPTPRKLPRWRGFNLLDKFHLDWSNRPFEEKHFAWIAELGFNFVRLPMDYRCWTDPADWTKLREEVLKEIDAAVRYGQKHGLHVCINFHRAPGYTVAAPPEPKSLWTDAEALKVCCQHWAHFAKRYKGIPNTQVSFNLFNEPANITPETHRRVVEQVVAAIREQDPNRLIICDGLNWARNPIEELLGLNVAGATRGYDPFVISHYKAEWVQGSDRWPEPTYPWREGNTVWDKQTLWERLYKPWKELERRGVGVMVGEFGAYNRTPHKVVLAWLRDLLSLWKEAGWGWAMWNFIGTFGIVDSGRADVRYEDWRGHKLDREVLQLLQSM